MKAKATGEDLYTIPFPRGQKLSKIRTHESLHGSGEIHFILEEEGGFRIKAVPVYGNDDQPAAIRAFLKIKCPLCVCIRKGRSFEKHKLERAVSRIVDYLPVRVDAKEVIESLNKRGYYRLVLKPADS